MIATENITLQRDGSRAFDAYLARPAAATKAPSIVIFTEMFGMCPHNFEMADRYAQRGFAALVPNLFWRAAFPGEYAYDEAGKQAAWARLAALDIDAAGRDIVTAVQWLRGQRFYQRQSLCARLLRRRPHGVRGGGARRRRCRGVVLRHGHRQARRTNSPR